MQPVQSDLQFRANENKISKKVNVVHLVFNYPQESERQKGIHQKVYETWGSPYTGTRMRNLTVTGSHTLAAELSHFELLGSRLLVRDGDDAELLLSGVVVVDDGGGGGIVGVGVGAGGGGDPRLGKGLHRALKVHGAVTAASADF